MPSISDEVLQEMLQNASGPIHYLSYERHGLVVLKLGPKDVGSYAIHLNLTLYDIRFAGKEAYVDQIILKKFTRPLMDMEMTEKAAELKEYLGKIPGALAVLVFPQHIRIECAQEDQDRIAIAAAEIMLCFYGLNRYKEMENLPIESPKEEL